MTVICLLAVAIPYAQSQVPTPGSGVKNQPIQQNATPGENHPPHDQRGTEKVPFVIKSVPTEQATQQAEEDRQERKAKAANEGGLTLYTGLLALFTLGLIVVGSIQVGLFVWQLRLARKGAEDAGKSAEAALKTANSLETANRAFVKMSHLPPGLAYNQMGETSVRMRVKNFGKTPARIIDVLVEFKCFDDIASIPDNPPIIETGSQVSAFLVEGDELFTGKQHSLGSPVIDKVQGGKITVLVWGYIDYLDAFDRRHRAGYGRVYNWTSDVEYDSVSHEDFKKRSNLDYVAKVGAYNYDSPYKDGQEYQV